MNHYLWTKILNYDLDRPKSEYGFSTRLAKENYWTKNFTDKAIVEYKKFMYLAAISDEMVSPSAVVDTVWHQHLVFTQSYTKFCNLAEKQIQHVPSTHNRDEVEKFKQAKERTKKLYNNFFGEQPPDIWDYPGMYESLELEKAKINIRTFVLLGILAFVALIVPIYHLLKPVYMQIGNPYFLIQFVVLSILTLKGLEIYNRHYLSDMVNKMSHARFLADLRPLELVYLKTQRLPDVINGVLNELILDRKIIVKGDHSFEKVKDSQGKTIEEFQALDALGRAGRAYYPGLLKTLTDKPCFSNIANCMDALKKYFIKSRKFGKLFYINFGVCSLLFMLGFVRYATGILRDKPVIQIAICLLILAVIIFIFLYRLTKLICTRIIPGFYEEGTLGNRKESNDWQWKYFLFGSTILTTSFAPIVRNVNQGDSGSSSNSSCGSSCGSSCSSCGGCGGD